MGSLIAGPLSDSIGRKPVIVVSDALFLVGSLLQAFAEEIWVLMVGRFVIGLAIGVSSMLVPVYLAELAPKNVRGRVIGIFQLLISIGIIVSSVLNFVLDRDWRLMVGVAAIPAGI